MYPKTFHIISSHQNLAASGWECNERTVPHWSSTKWYVSASRLHGGVREGVDIIEIHNGHLTFVVLPTRGMGIHQAWVDKHRLGWDAPVRGPVHPSFLRLEEEKGLGWLRGFDEWFVRCGMGNNGAPDTENGYSLHGKISNTPAEEVELILVDKPSPEIILRGRMREATLYGTILELETEIRTAPGSEFIIVRDRITNQSALPTDAQMLYHVNFGPSLLEEGGKIHAPVRELWPMNDISAPHVKNWNRILEPRDDFQAQVFLTKLHSERSGKTAVLLVNRTSSFATSIEFNTRSLPFFCIWKNLVSKSDGYVVGLEPATNFPYPKTLAKKLEQVISLKPKQSWEAEVKLQVHLGKASVEEAQNRIGKLQTRDPILNSKPFISQLEAK